MPTASEADDSIRHAVTSTRESPVPPASFDYIVIGGGSAGSACAALLALRSDARVLLLEGGGSDELPELHEPSLWLAALSTRATKFYQTTPQPGIDGRHHDWPRGHVLGGSSSINAMIFARGHRSDFDSWAAEGNPGWDFDSLLPIFKAMEDFEGGASAYRGVGGPLHVLQPAPGRRHEGAEAFMQACGNLGYQETPDFNGERMEGQSWVNLSIKDGRRHSSASAFLRPAMRRANLTVLTDAPVIGLVIRNGRCEGVRYLHGDTPRTVLADSEVILSAGAIDSPVLLLRSGIGPAADLAALGIAQQADLPVGLGLQDHVLGAGCNYAATAPVPPSHYNFSETYLWERSDARSPGPDMVALYVSLPFVSSGLQLPAGDGYSILSCVSRPVSRGFIRLASADPAAAPMIEPNYLAEAADWRIFRTATELCRELGADRAYDPFRKAELLPGCGALTEGEWRAFLAKSATTLFHPTSTCRMGPGRNAVVDPQLRVHGISGLRVADASIMPSITTANTNAASIMIGWKCAEMILRERVD